MSPSESDSAAPRDVLAWLEGQVRDWILAQRAEHRPRAEPILAAACPFLEPFFGQGVLGRARCRTVPRIEDPPFLAVALAVGVPQTIDFTQMAGITFQDTVLLSQAQPIPPHPSPHLGLKASRRLPGHFKVCRGRSSGTFTRSRALRLRASKQKSGFTAPLAAQAQQPAKVYRLGYLFEGRPTSPNPKITQAAKR